MNHDTQVELLKRLMAHIDANTTDSADRELFIPVSTYVADDRADAERAVIARTPIVVAHSTELAAPGDYVTAELMGTSVLVVRQDDGGVRAFTNVCRHRGAKVVLEPCGSKRVFSCPYHGWAYDRDGSLRSISTTEGFEQVSHDDFPLVRLPVAERHGLIWLVLTPGEELDILDYIGDEIDAEFDELQVGTFVPLRQETFEHPMNWKLIADGFMEVYHLKFLHAKTIATVARSNIQIHDRMGRHVRSVSARYDIDELRDKPTEEWELLRHSIMSYKLLPTTVFAVVRDHFEVWTILPDPDRADRCTVTLRFFTPRPVESEKEQNYWNRNWDMLMRTVTTEDWLMAQNIQDAMARSGVPDFVAGRNELALQYLHTYLNDGVLEVEAGGFAPAWLG